MDGEIGPEAVAEALAGDLAAMGGAAVADGG